MSYWHFWARKDQLPPKGDWHIWLLLGGRGAGKTRAGAEWVRAQIEGSTPLAKGAYRRIALVGETLHAVREVMIEGSSGLRVIAPSSVRPRFSPTRRLLEWPNGATAQIFSSASPEHLRGPQFDAAWCDELAKWHYDEATWDMLQFGLRLGHKPRQVVTTTPKPTALIKRLLDDPLCQVSRASTRANQAHLAPGFLAELLRHYEGSRLGRQEIEAELLEDVVGALWSLEMVSRHRVQKAPALQRVVVAVDPPATTSKQADACGICVVGRDDKAHFYVLADRTVQGLSPARWAKCAISAYKDFKADRLVAEVNQGGDLVREVVLQQAPYLSYRSVRATRGKMLRAEPIAALYERGLVHHIGVFEMLENEMFHYDGKGGKSPDRLDALVWGLSDLLQDEAKKPNPILRRI